MDTKALRQKILDLAIRGKLVPQDPNDEPASVLLERICAEKQQMVKDGKLKAKDIKNDTVIFKGEDNLHYEKFADGTVKCIEEEIPFELPEGWEWCRLINICSKLIDGDHNPPKGEDTVTQYLMLSSTNINNDTLVELEKVRYLSKDIFDKENQRTDVNIGDIFFTSVGSIGRSCVYTGGFNICFQRSVSVIRTFILNEYLKRYLDAPFIQNKIAREATGTAQKGFYLNQLSNCLIAVPPINEQQKIANAVNKLMEYIVSIETDKTTLLETIQSTKSKILDLAIRGKLVPQDPNDEPASVLLERIRAEKEELIKQGKIKRDKRESVIFKGEDNSYYEKVGSEVRCIDEELPFEIPDNWEWVRLWSLFSHNTGKALNSKSQVGSPYKYITTSNLYWNRFELGNLKQMLFSESELEKCTVRKGDLLVCEGGDIGRSAIWNYDEEIRIQNHIHRLRPYTDLNVNFYYYTMYLYKVTDRINGKGIGIQGLSSNQLHTLPLPLPPLSEQQRITAKIKALFDILDSIENALIE